MTITMLVCFDYLLSQNYLLHLSSNMSRESLKRIRSGLIVLFGLLLLYVILCIYTDDIDAERNTISQFGQTFIGEVSRVDSWPHGIQLAQWREHFVPSNNLYNWEWDRIARGLRLHRGQSLLPPEDK